MCRLRSAAIAPRQQGVSLIEVLVALVVLTIGILSVIALQLVAKRNNADAGQREIAAQLAYDMIERMRANSTAAGLAMYVQEGADGVGRGQRGAEPTPTCRDGSACNSEQLAVHDLWAWEQLLDGVMERAGEDATGGLVDATGCLTGPVGGGNGLYTVTIAWRSTIALPSNADNDCGRDAEGGALYGPNDQFRRVVSIPAYIAIR